MAIVNRDLDVSQQKQVLNGSVSTTVGASAGLAFPAITIATPGFVKTIELTATGVSGAATIALDVQRFVVGSGLTTIPYLSTTMAIASFGTSGIKIATLAAAGSTLLNLQMGDVITVNQLFSGGNVAIGKLEVNAVVQAAQDIVAYFGSST